MFSFTDSKTVASYLLAEFVPENGRVGCLAREAAWSSRHSLQHVRAGDTELGSAVMS